MKASPKRTQLLASLLKQSEGPTLEFKRSTGELVGALHTLCGYLNTAGGTVLFGVNRKGVAEGQHVSEQTIHEITATFGKFEPSPNIHIQRFKVKPGHEVIGLTVDDNPESIPYTFEGRAYERVGNTTRKMPQGQYEKLLLERAHAKRRWENQPAAGVKISDLDRKEILRTRELAIQQNRISPDTGRSIPEILDRLGLLTDGKVTQAAQMLYGKKFLPYYPQSLLKMGRFRGTQVTGEIVDNRQENLNAFQAVREGMAFLERTLPLGARFPKGKIFREDHFPIPMSALREILLNAVMHRDYSQAGGYVAIAVFDDRVEIRSCGDLPTGITVENLRGPHSSKPRNPLIAGAFHRTGAVEVWGRGTNRVIDECRRIGITPPTFEETQGFLFVTFKTNLIPGSQKGTEKSKEKGKEKSREKIIRLLQSQPTLTTQELIIHVGLSKSGIEKIIRQLKKDDIIKRIGPDKGGHWEITR